MQATLDGAPVGNVRPRRMVLCRLCGESAGSVMHEEFTVDNFRTVKDIADRVRRNML